MASNSSNNENHEFNILNVQGKNESSIVSKSYIKYTHTSNNILEGKTTRLSMFDYYGDRTKGYIIQKDETSSGSGIFEYEIDDSNVNSQNTYSNSTFAQNKLVATKQGLRFKLRGSMEFKDDLFDRSAYKFDLNKSERRCNKQYQIR